MCCLFKKNISSGYIVSLLCFHLSLDAVTKGAVTKMENLATRYLKKWLSLPRSVICAILYYPGMCCPSITQVSRQAKLSLLSCISTTSDIQLQELGLQLYLGDSYLQTNDSILSEAQSQLPMARHLYLQWKKLAVAHERLNYDEHLDTLSVQSKLKDSITLQSSCSTWNRLLLGCNPGQFSFILCAASDTLPTPVNLKCWYIQCGAKCKLCGHSQPTRAHILGGCPVALSQGRFTYHHDKILHCLATELLMHFDGSSVILLYTDLPGMQASDCPQATIALPSSSLPIVRYSDLQQGNNSIAMLEFTCPLDSTHHLEAARDCKQGKTEYQEILSEFQHMGVDCFYDTLELSVLGHYLPSSLTSLKNCHPRWRNFSIKLQANISIGCCYFHLLFTKNILGKELLRMVGDT